MRCQLLALLSVLVWCSPGCMRCEHGLCSPGEPEAIFDSALLGEWTPIDPEPEDRDVCLKVERDERQDSVKASLTSSGWRDSGTPQL